MPFFAELLLAVAVMAVLGPAAADELEPQLFLYGLLGGRAIIDDSQNFGEAAGLVG